MNNRVLKQICIALTICLVGCSSGNVSTETHRDVYGGSTSVVVFANSSNSDSDMTYFAASDSRTFGTTSTGDHVDFEALLGINLVTSGNTLSVKAYANNDKNLPDGKVLITRIDVARDKKSGTRKVIADTFDLQKVITYDCKGLADGIYQVDAEFDKITTYGFIVKDSSGVHTCRTLLSDIDKERQERFDKVLAKVNPKDNLSIKNLSYPSELRENYHAADKLCKLADSLVKDSYSDELKVYAVYDYARRNWAFDSWYANQGHNGRHNRFNDTWTDSRAFLPDSNVGVCAGFMNATVIMLRHLGIPACGITSESIHHAWVAAYLNGEWVTFDTNEFVTHTCNQEDTDKTKWTSRGSNFETYYGNKEYAEDMIINGEELRTYKN